MQTKGGGKHDILPAAEARSDRALLPVNDAPRTRCGHVPGLFQRAEEHGRVHGASEPSSATSIPRIAYDQP